MITIFSLIENTGVSLEDILETRYPYFEEWAEEIAKVEERYRAKKLETNSADFDDLLILPLRLFRENEDILERYQKRFGYLLVDEYQDTNAVQSELIDLLSKPRYSVMVVGDDAQSIYSWRGADMDNILSFPERYPNAKVYKIETNYRSVPEVLELSNASIAVNRKQFTKTLNAARDGGRMTPALIPVEDPRTQANFVAQRILELRDEGIEIEEMAVLYRAHYQSLEIQMELTSRGIPFEITSGLRFFEQAHIKDIAAFLRFVTNRKDEVSFKRFTLLLPGVGARTADKIWAAWLKTGHQGDDNPPKKFSEVLLKIKVPAKAARDWEQLAYTMDELVTPDGFARPSEMITSVLEGVYDEHMRQSFDNYENRRQDIEQLIMYSESFDDILELLGQLSLMSAVDGEPNGKREELDGEKLTLSSIHQAKGLEYKVVFLIWLADGMFPNNRVLEADDEEMLEEERRLFYVALTRAKDELYLTYPQLNPKSYSGDIITRPSRFLDECPEEMMEVWEVGPAW